MSSSVAAQLKGTFRDCGSGNPPQLDYNCQGPKCNGLDQFPLGSTKDNGGGNLDYKSDSRCGTFDSPYYGPIMFEMKDTGGDSRVSQEQNMTLSNCKGLHIFSDGTTSGTTVNGYTRNNDPGCGPAPAQSSPASSPVVCTLTS